MVSFPDTYWLPSVYFILLRTCFVSFYFFLFFLFLLLILLLFGLEVTQQTFVLMKTSWRLLEDVFHLRLQKTYSRSLQDVLIKTNIFTKRFQDVFKTSCQDIFKTSSRRLAKTSSRHLQDVFKTTSRHLQEVFKTFRRRLQDALQRPLQNVLKTYHQLKLFLLTRFQNDTYSKRFWDVLQRRLSIEGFA